MKFYKSLQGAQGIAFVCVITLIFTLFGLSINHGMFAFISSMLISVGLYTYANSKKFKINQSLAKIKQKSLQGEARRSFNFLKHHKDTPEINRFVKCLRDAKSTIGDINLSNTKVIEVITMVFRSNRVHRISDKKLEIQNRTEQQWLDDTMVEWIDKHQDILLPEGLTDEEIELNYHTNKALDDWELAQELSNSTVMYTNSMARNLRAINKTLSHINISIDDIQKTWQQNLMKTEPIAIKSNKVFNQHFQTWCEDNADILPRNYKTTHLPEEEGPTQQPT